jgi:hypothetical protein
MHEMTHIMICHIVTNDYDEAVDQSVNLLMSIGFVQNMCIKKSINYLMQIDIQILTIYSSFSCISFSFLSRTDLGTYRHDRSTDPSISSIQGRK